MRAGDRRGQGDAAPVPAPILGEEADGSKWRDRPGLLSSWDSVSNRKPDTAAREGDLLEDDPWGPHDDSPADAPIRRSLDQAWLGRRQVASAFLVVGASRRRDETQPRRQKEEISRPEVRRRRKRLSGPEKAECLLLGLQRRDKRAAVAAPGCEQGKQERGEANARRGQCPPAKVSALTQGPRIVRQRRFLRVT